MWEEEAVCGEGTIVRGGAHLRDRRQPTHAPIFVATSVVTASVSAMAATTGAATT